MENSYPGALPKTVTKLQINPLLGRTRHMSISTSNLKRPTRKDRADTVVNNQYDFDGPSQRSDFIPLLASAGFGGFDNFGQESLSKEEAKERMEGLSQLINRLEDTTGLLRDQLHSVKKTLKGDKSKPRIIRPIIPFLYKYQLIIVVAIQLISLTLLTVYDTHYQDSTGLDQACKVFMVIFQTLNTVHVVIATIKLSKKIKNGGLGTVMAQTYLSTVFVFAGLYLCFYRFNHDSWEMAANDQLNKGNAFVQFVRMLYLSVSSATLCGAANIQPKAWYTTILVCFQCTINYVYFASILAATIGNFSSYTVSVAHRDSIVNEVLQHKPNNASRSNSYRNTYGTNMVD